MDLIDIIKELRKGEPEPEKTGRILKFIAWGCGAVAVWNVSVFYLVPSDEIPFNIPRNYSCIALICLLFIGGLFLYSSRQVSKSDPAGKMAGQISIILLVALIVGSMVFMFTKMTFPTGSHRSFSLFYIGVFTVFLVQFIIPAYFGVRYLGRLPVRKTSAYLTGVDKKDNQTEHFQQDSVSQTKYKDALFPLGVFGTFALLLATFLITFFAIERIGGPKLSGFSFVPIFMLIFLAPAAYNFLPSPFQEKREVISSFTGGGSIFLFNGTWPFFKLIVYDDGLEIRFMFHRFFIPYDKMHDISEKVGFFSRGLFIKSTLPGVPSGIRFYGFGMKKIVRVVTQHRNRFLRK